MKNIENTLKWQKDLEEIFLYFFGNERRHFYIEANGEGRVYLKTGYKYKKYNNNQRHPYEAVGKLIVKHYYKFGKDSVYDFIAKGVFKKG